jgi:hypothetical protein
MPASIKTIHPSKRRKLPSTAELKAGAEKGVTSSESDVMDTETSGDECYESESGNDTEVTEQDPKRKMKQQTDVAVELITSSKVSTSKAAKLCKTLSQEGIAVPTPCQSAIYKALFRKAQEVYNYLK